MPPACRGLNCTSTQLIEAHIIPAGFGKMIRGGGPNVQLMVGRGKVREANPQLGEYDPKILCQSCDAKLGLLDQYALAVCKKTPLIPPSTKAKWFELSGIDCDRFSMFVLAVLWRASISTRENFAPIALGPYEELAQRILFDAEPLSSFAAFQLIVMRYVAKGTDPKGFYSQPMRYRFRGLNAYWFSLGGFKLVAIIDAKRLPRKLAPLVLNESGEFWGPIIKMEETSEYEALLDLLRDK